MSTITTAINVSDTNKRFKRALMAATSSYDVGTKLSHTRSSLVATESVEFSFTTLCVAYFPKPTLIQLTIDGVISTPTVDGMLMLPFAGTIKVQHPGVGTTDPTEVEFLTS